ncbi:DVU3141 family protein [Zobellella endophytica]|nr:DVU3141 family protein [Zobellella endophytica]
MATATGCATQRGSIDQPGYGGHQTALSPQLNDYLSSAATGSAITMAQTPWGDNVLVLANQPYYAASGRTCRELEVTLSSGTTQHHIACQTGDTSWASVRPVTRLLNR